MPGLLFQFASELLYVPITTLEAKKETMPVRQKDYKQGFLYKR